MSNWRRGFGQVSRIRRFSGGGGGGVNLLKSRCVSVCVCVCVSVWVCVCVYFCWRWLRVICRAAAVSRHVTRALGLGFGAFGFGAFGFGAFGAHFDSLEGPLPLFFPPFWLLLASFLDIYLPWPELEWLGARKGRKRSKFFFFFLKRNSEKVEEEGQKKKSNVNFSLLDLFPLFFHGHFEWC